VTTSQRTARTKSLADSFPASDPVSTHVPPTADGPTARREAPAARQVADRKAGAYSAHPRGREPRPSSTHGHVVHRGDHELYQHLPTRRSCSARGSWRATPCRRGCRSSPGSRPRSRPGSKVVTEYLGARRAGRVPRRAGASTSSAMAAPPASATGGPLPQEISDVVVAEDLAVVSVLSGNRKLRGPHQPRREDELPRLPPRCASRTRSPGRWTSTSMTTRWARTRTATPCISRTSGPIPRRWVRTVEGRRSVRHVPQVLRTGLRRRRALELARGCRPAMRSSGMSAPRTCAGRRSLRRCRGEAPSRWRTSSTPRVLAKLGDQRHHRPHLPGRLDQA